MLRWLFSWLVTLGWYALIGGGWWCWWRAYTRAEDLERQVRVMSNSWRYAARHTERSRDHV